MKPIAVLGLFLAAALFSRGATTVSGMQESRPLKVADAPRIEQLAVAVLISSDYEASAGIGREAHWRDALGASYLRLVFSEPRKFSFRFSTTGPATTREVLADEILMHISRAESPDYILVRFHGRVRAFAKYDCDALLALQKVLPSHPDP